MSKIQDEISVDFNFKKEINNEESKEIKPKAKRASKKIIVEDIKPVEPVEPVEDIEEIPKNIKTLELVQCEKCNKK